VANKYVYERLADGRFRPKIARIFPFAQTVEAYKYLESNTQVGKVVICSLRKRGIGEAQWLPQREAAIYLGRNEQQLQSLCRGRAKGGIFGNSAIEAMYPLTRVLPNGETLDDSKHNYIQKPVPDRQPDQSLSDQLADAAGAEKECEWLADSLHPERLAGESQGIQLVASAERPDLSGHAIVLSKGNTAVDTATRFGHMAAAGNSGRAIAW
jgi:hypothetical protein